MQSDDSYVRAKLSRKGPTDARRPAQTACSVALIALVALVVLLSLVAFIAVLGREPRLHAVDIPRPPALEDRAALRALADIGLEVPPLDDSLRLARPEHEARFRWHDRRRGHELRARRGLLGGDVVELVALAARHLGHLPHREGEELAFAADDGDEAVRP